MIKVRKPIGKHQHTVELILLYLQTVARPVRTSDVRKAVLRVFPEASIYGALGELQTAGRVKRLSFERDALMELTT